MKHITLQAITETELLKPLVRHLTEVVDQANIEKEKFQKIRKQQSEIGYRDGEYTRRANPAGTKAARKIAKKRIKTLKKEAARVKNRVKELTSDATRDVITLRVFVPSVVRGLEKKYGELSYDKELKLYLEPGFLNGISKTIRIGNLNPEQFYRNLEREFSLTPVGAEWNEFISSIEVEDE